jgi:hypothetical protein
LDIQMLQFFPERSALTFSPHRYYQKPGTLPPFEKVLTLPPKQVS